MEIFKLLKTQSSPQNFWNLNDEFRYDIERLSPNGGWFDEVAINFSVIEETDLILKINVKEEDISDVISVKKDFYNKKYYYCLNSFTREGTTLIATYDLDTVTTFTPFFKNNQSDIYIEKAHLNPLKVYQTGANFKGQKIKKEVEYQIISTFYSNISNPAKNAVLNENGVIGYAYGVLKMGVNEQSQPTINQQPFYALCQVYLTNFNGDGSNGIWWYEAIQNVGDEFIDIIVLPLDLTNNAILPSTRQSNYKAFTGASNPVKPNCPVYLNETTNTVLAEDVLNIDPSKGNLTQQSFYNVIQKLSVIDLVELINVFNTTTVVNFSNDTLVFYLWEYFKELSFTFMLGNTSTTFTFDYLFSNEMLSSNKFKNIFKWDLDNLFNFGWSFNYPNFNFFISESVTDFASAKNNTNRMLTCSNLYNYVKGSTWSFIQNNQAIIKQGKEALNIQNQYSSMENKEQYFNDMWNFLNPKNWLHIPEMVEDDANKHKSYENEIKLRKISWNIEYGNAKKQQLSQLNNAVVQSGTYSLYNSAIQINFNQFTLKQLILIAQDVYAEGINVKEIRSINMVDNLETNKWYFFKGETLGYESYSSFSSPQTPLFNQPQTSAQWNSLNNHLRKGITFIVSNAEYNVSAVNYIQSLTYVTDWSYNQNGVI